MKIHPGFFDKLSSVFCAKDVICLFELWEEPSDPRVSVAVVESEATLLFVFTFFVDDDAVIVDGNRDSSVRRSRTSVLSSSKVAIITHLCSQAYQARTDLGR
jgi:hypothetical protein